MLFLVLQASMQVASIAEQIHNQCKRVTLYLRYTFIDQLNQKSTQSQHQSETKV